LGVFCEHGRTGGAYEDFLEIDYYDTRLTKGSQAPGDPRQTVRVLTIMLASEYWCSYPAAAPAQGSPYVLRSPRLLPLARRTAV